MWDRMRSEMLITFSRFYVCTKCYGHKKWCDSFQLVYEIQFPIRHSRAILRLILNSTAVKIGFTWTVHMFFINVQAHKPNHLSIGHSYGCEPENIHNATYVGFPHVEKRIDFPLLKYSKETIAFKTSAHIVFGTESAYILLTF